MGAAEPVRAAIRSMHGVVAAAVGGVVASPRVWRPWIRSAPMAYGPPHLPSHDARGYTVRLSTTDPLLWRMAEQLRRDHRPGVDGWCVTCREPRQVWPCAGVTNAELGLLRANGAGFLNPESLDAAAERVELGALWR